MSDSLDQQLLGHLLGALDDDEQETLDARLEHDEGCCRRLAAWRRRVASLEAMRPDFDPPPGLAARTCRYVAASMPAAVAASSTRRMTPVSAVPGPANGVRWPDLVAGALLLMMATAVLFPAIAHSRFQTRLTSCQDGLRQFGRALSHYSDLQRTPLEQLVVDGRLTGFGALAARQLRDDYVSETPRDLCPDAWLAAQGVLGDMPRSSPRPQPIGGQPWLGTRRNGTDDGWQLPLIAAPSPLLADAPSADLPNQPLDSHAGQGRNVLFEDGHTAFLPAVYDTPAGWVLSRADALSDPRDPMALQFVRGH